ncbi:hypothetical protein ACO0QE_003531 [Hanseniaspora vineae]
MSSVSHYGNKKKKQFSASNRNRSATSFKGVNKLCRVASFDQQILGNDFGHENASLHSNGSNLYLDRVRSIDSLNKRRTISSLSMTALCKLKSGNSINHNKHMSTSASNATTKLGNSVDDHKNLLAGIKPKGQKTRKKKALIRSTDPDTFVRNSSTDEDVEHFTNDDISSSNDSIQTNTNIDEENQNPAEERPDNFENDTFKEVGEQVRQSENDEYQQPIGGGENELGTVEISSTEQHEVSKDEAQKESDVEDYNTESNDNSQHVENQEIPFENQIDKTSHYGETSHYTSLRPNDSLIQQYQNNESLDTKDTSINLQPELANTSNRPLSYVVPSSLRRNSRISADNIGNLRTSQESQHSLGLLLNTNYLNNEHTVDQHSSNEDRIKPSYLDDASQNDKIPEYIGDIEEEKELNDLKANENLLSEHALHLAQKNPSGKAKSFDDINSESVEPEKTQGSASKIEPEYLPRQSTDLEQKEEQGISEERASYKAPQNAVFMQSSRQDDTLAANPAPSTYASTGKSVTSNHQFNYINKDFLNSSDSLSTLNRPTTDDTQSINSNEKPFTTNAQPIQNSVAQNAQITSISESAESLSQNSPGESQPTSLINNLVRPSSQSSQKSDFSSSISSLAIHLQRPVTRNNASMVSRSNQTQIPSKNSQNSLLRLATVNNIGLNSKTVPQQSKGSYARAHNTNSKRTSFNASSTKTGNSALNDFSSFLKSDSNDAESRTQQKLWLQRENSILDLSSDALNNQLDAVFMATSVEAKRESERISREYAAVKRYNNPLYTSIQKINKDLRIEEAQPSKNKPSTTDLTKLFSTPIENAAPAESTLMEDLLSPNVENMLKGIWHKETQKFIQDDVLGSNPQPGSNSLYQNRSSALMRNNSGSQLYQGHHRSGSIYHSHSRSRGMGSYNSGVGVIR